MNPSTDVVRLVYASRANFLAGRDNASINADVARILMQSRRNNPAQGLVGALYFADGNFFQCLEGPAAAVDALYARLHDDPRHRELKVLARSPVQRPSFSGWSMKFVPNASAVRALLRKHGLAGFDPYAFTPAILADMVALLVDGADAGAVEAADGATPTSPPTSASAPDPLALARQARLLATLALVVSLVAAGLVLAR